MKHNSRKYSRRMSYLKALRKQRIDRERSGQRWPLYYNNLHQYSKNKIHCSCPLCSAKTRNKGRRKHNNWAPSINYTISDLRKVEAMNAAEKDYLIDFF